MCSNLLIHVTFQLEKVHLKFLPSKFIYDIDFNNKRIDYTRQSLDLSLASAVLGEIDPRFVPILQSPLQLQPPRPSLCHPLLPTTVNTRFCGWLLVPSQPWAPRYTRIIPKRSKLQSPTWSTCICGLPVHLSLGFHSNCKSVAGQKHWENARVPYISRRFEIRAMAESSSGICRSCLKMSGVTALVPRKRSWAQRKPWNRSCCESASPGFCPQRCPPDFLEKCFLDHKVIKDNHPTNSSGQPEAGLGETSLKCSPLSMTESLQGQHLLKTCCSSLASWLQPESAFNFLTSHKPSSKLQTKCKQ